MVAATEIDALEARMTRVEEALHAIEVRVAALDHVAQTRSAAPEIEEPSESPLFDFALIGKSVLIVGGAYLLRALTEIGLVPQGAGVAMAFLYAMAWVAIAARDAARGRRAPALFAASTASMIAAALIWEATVRFHILGTVLASALTLVTTLAVLAIAVLRRDTAFAFVAAALMTFTSIGLAIGTADVLTPAIAVALAGVVAARLQLDSYVTLSLATASDFLAIGLIAMAAVDRVPDSHAAVALISIAVLWVVVIETRPRWPESMQTASIMLLAAGGAGLLTLKAPALAVVWGTLAALTAAIGRASQRDQWTMQAPFWALAATAAAFLSEPRPLMLLVAGALTFVTLALVPADAGYSRVTLLAIVTVIALASVDGLLIRGSAGVLAMERSLAIAVTAVLLSVIGQVRPEAARLAPLVLVFGGIKLLVEDFRTGSAATIAVALAAYGTAMVIIARRRAPRLTLKENA
jgi:hypothetical protein